MKIRPVGAELFHADRWPNTTLFVTVRKNLLRLSQGWPTGARNNYILTASRPALGIPFKADSYIACRAHAVTLPCRAAKSLECVFPIWFSQCGRVWFTLAMLCPCRALTMPFFSRPQHSTVGYLRAFGFFRLRSGVPRRLLSEAYQSQMQVASVKPNNVCHGRGIEL